MPRRGPNTPEGRNRIRHNALKHGILSTEPVLPWVEKQEEWDAFRDSIFESIQPEGGLEGALTDRVAGLLWRLARAVRAEVEATVNAQSQIGANIGMIYEMQQKPVPDLPDEEFKTLADQQLMATLLPDEKTVGLIMRYETRAHRHLLQTLHQLALIKGFRRNLPHNSKHGVANLDPPSYNRNNPALPQGPSLTTRT